MSQIQRQDNLFSAEDWKTIYRTFSQANFTAYDYDSIRDSMLSYIQTNYPEDFNDYIQSSEFVAIIDLLAYLGQSLAFRTDLNARENFFDTAERRESILRLAKLVNYQPKRNVPARGLMKITRVRTTEPLTDSNGTEIANTDINWNDPNNAEWYDQWLTVCNSAFQSANQFGNPVKNGTVSTIPAEIYNINSADPTVIKNLSEVVDGINTSLDVVKADINTAGYFEEMSPDRNIPYNMIYRNDSQGFASPNTGFFVYFKEGQLKYEDRSFAQPVPNRTVDIDENDINDTDIFVQKVDGTGSALEKWKKVPSLFGQNTIYNSLALADRNIYSVQSRNNDQISIAFSDGNFGNAPSGQFRVWFRTSEGKGQVLKANRITNSEISITYQNSQSQEYTLTLGLSLTYTVTNSQATETDQEIKNNAPQSFYTQDRMVNGEDYNIFPLTKSNSIRKIKSVNKTHIGHSRYIDINDPTGTVKNVNVFGDDGMLYKDPNFSLNSEELTGTVVDTTSINYIIQNVLGPLLQKIQVRNYYYDSYKTAVESFKGANFFQMDNSTVNQVYWMPKPAAGTSSTGYFYINDTGNQNNDAVTVYNNPNSANEKLGFIRPGSKIEFVDDYVNTKVKLWATVVSIRNDGGMLTADTTGSIQLNKSIPKGYRARGILPSFRTSLSATEKSSIKTRMENGEDFGIGYNYRDANLASESWYVIPESNINTTNDFGISFNTSFGGTEQALSDTSWLIKATYVPATSTTTNPKYEFSIRGLDYVFESEKEVRFFYTEDYKNRSSVSGKAVRDTIDLLDINKDKTVLTDPNSKEKLDGPITLGIVDGYTEADGYVDPKKVKVTNFDKDQDGSPDNPVAHDEILDNSKYIFFSSYQDYDGYTYYKPTGDVTQVNTAAEASTVNGVVLITNDSTTSYNNFLWKGSGDGIVGNLSKLPNAEGGSSYTKLIGVLGSTVYKAFIGRRANADEKLFFQYKHTAPRDQRVDPSVSNIIELIVLQNEYNTDVNNWFTSGETRANFPATPTAEEIRSAFPELESYKTISDQIVYSSAKFKLLFGPTADEQNQAVFRVVKVPGATYTDNQIKSEIISAVTEYFNINNWDFGETFYYSELAAYVHSRLSTQISSVVIVPKDAEAKFGDLFQIKAATNELFFSTATVNQVEIVTGLTGSNLRSNTTTTGSSLASGGGSGGGGSSGGGY